MSVKVPIRTVFDGSTATGLAEYQSGEFIGLTHGGTGASLSIGSAGQVLKTDGSGNLSWVSQPTAGISQFDQWRFTGSPSGNQDPLSGSWERNDSSYDKVGTGMTESSGVFTFPTTGIYLIFYNIFFKYFN